MRTIKKSLILAALSTAILSSNAFAFDDNVYVGFGVGEVDLDNKAFDKPTGFEVFGGYEFNQNIAFEASYVDLGEAGDGAAPQWVLSSDTLTLGVVGKFPVGEQIELVGKLGYHFWDTELSEDGFGLLGENDGSDIFYSVGANYKLTQEVSIGGRYNIYDTDAADISFLSVNVQYNF